MAVAPEAWDILPPGLAYSNVCLLWQMFVCSQRCFSQVCHYIESLDDFWFEICRSLTSKWVWCWGYLEETGVNCLMFKLIFCLYEYSYLCGVREKAVAVVFVWFSFFIPLFVHFSTSTLSLDVFFLCFWYTIICMYTWRHVGDSI